MRPSIEVTVKGNQVFGAVGCFFEGALNVAVDEVQWLLSWLHGGLMRFRYDLGNGAGAAGVFGRRLAKVHALRHAGEFDHVLLS